MKAFHFYAGMSLCPGICMSDKSTSNPEVQNEPTAHPENWPVNYSKLRPFGSVRRFFVKSVQD